MVYRQTGKHRAAVVQMNSSADIAANLQRAAVLIAQASDHGAVLTVLPESFACIGATPTAYLEAAEPQGHGRMQDFLSEQAARHRVWLLGGTIPIHAADGGRVYAQSILYDAAGNPVAHYRKVHLFDVCLDAPRVRYAESRTFCPGDQIVVAATPAGRLGIAVCYDVRFPEMFRRMLEQDVQIIALPAAFTRVTGAAHWHSLLRARAIENQTCVLAAAQTGRHADRRETYGHSLIIDAWGRTLAGLSDRVGVASATLDMTAQNVLRQNFPCLQHRVFY